MTLTTDPNRLLNEIRIATPCTASWDEMTGNDTVRFCGECKLNVYNISSMTAASAALLVDQTEGRLCVRLYKRKDGTVLTEDCPVGVRARLHRMGRAAGMALTAILGLFAGGTTRAADGNKEPRDRTIKMGKIAMPARQGVEVLVTVRGGEHDLSVAGAAVTLENLGTGVKLEAEEGEDAQYRFAHVEPGVYTLTINAPGYETSKPRTLRVRAGEPLHLTVPLDEMTILMGAIAPEPVPEPEPAPEPEVVVMEESDPQ
jgi:hypothetical protein